MTTHPADSQEIQRLTAAVRQLRDHYPNADPTMVVRAVIDARDGLAAFGFRNEERSATLISELAASDPRLRVGDGCGIAQT